MTYKYSFGEPDFTVKSIDIQNVVHPKGYRHSFPDGRSKHGFIYTVSGQMCNTFRDKSIERICAAAGELVFVPKGCVYTGTYLEENTEIKLVQFDSAEGALPVCLSAPTKLELPHVGELMEAFFRPIENHLSNHSFYYFSCLYKLLWQIDENYSKIPTKYKKLHAALAEMNTCWQKNESVARYADMCGLSEGGFRRLFREYTGLSPIEYRNELRLTNAKSKLQSGEYNVSEAAALCGFSNLSFFARLYKRKYGYTPKEE